MSKKQTKSLPNGYRYRTVKFKLPKNGLVDTWLKSQRSAPESLINIISIIAYKYGKTNNWFSVITPLASKAVDQAVTQSPKIKANQPTRPRINTGQQKESSVTSGVNKSDNKVTPEKINEHSSNKLSNSNNNIKSSSHKSSGLGNAFQAFSQPPSKNKNKK